MNHQENESSRKMSIKVTLDFGHGFGVKKRDFEQIKKKKFEKNQTFWKKF
jgi:hypothetical protein